MLRWIDIDLMRDTRSVQRGVHRVWATGLVYEEPKSDRSRRTLAVPSQPTDALREQAKQQAKERAYAEEL